MLNLSFIFYLFFCINKNKWWFHTFSKIPWIFLKRLSLTHVFLNPSSPILGILFPSVNCINYYYKPLVSSFFLFFFFSFFFLGCRSTKSRRNYHFLFSSNLYSFVYQKKKKKRLIFICFWVDKSNYLEVTISEFFTCALIFIYLFKLTLVK